MVLHGVLQECNDELNHIADSREQAVPCRERPRVESAQDWDQS
jgi:hypothetical protein